MFIKCLLIIVGCFICSFIHATIVLFYKEKKIRREYNKAVEEAISLANYTGDSSSKGVIEAEVRMEFRKIYKGYYIEHLFE